MSGEDPVLLQGEGGEKHESDQGQTCIYNQ